MGDMKAVDYLEAGTVLAVGIGAGFSGVTAKSGWFGK
jgi:hypothetical protein